MAYRDDKNGRLICFLGFLVLLLFAKTGQATSAFDLKFAKEHRYIGEFSYFLSDEDQQLSFDTLPANDDPRWQSSKEKILSKGYSEAALWVRLEIENSLVNNDWMFEVGYPILDFLDVHVRYADRVETHYLGDRLTFSERPIPNRNFVIPFKLETNESAEIILRVETGSSLKVPIRIWTEKAFYEHQQESLLFYGTFFGFMLVMIVYNLILYSFIQEIRYVFYVTFATSFVVFQASLSGLGYQFFWPENAAFNEQVLPVSLGITLLFETLFVSTFLNLRVDAQRADYFLRVIMLLLAVLTVAALFQSNRDAIRPLIAIGILLNVLFFFFGLQRWHDGNRAARIFTIAWSFPVFSGVFVGLVAFGLMEHTALTEYGMAVSMVLAVVLLSFALGESIAQQREERIQAREEANKLSIAMEKERDINREITALNSVISEARDESEKRRQVVSDLLNNSSQGFIAFGEDLLIEPDFSRACMGFFNDSPEGCPVYDLLYPIEETGGREFFKKAIAEILIEDDEFRRDMMLSLLPTQFSVRGHCLEAEYKPLRGKRVMMVLTDVTNEIKLQEQVEQEHRRLEMIVSAVTDQRDVIETIGSFRRFLIEVCKDEGIGGGGMDSDELYRKVHTFKGLFNQFSFVQLPEVLHSVESMLSQNDRVNDLPIDKLWQAFDADMDVIVERLGANFNENQGFVQVSGQALEDLGSLVNNYLAVPGILSRQEELQTLAVKVALLDKVELQEMFTPLLRGTYGLARELGKQIHVAFQGEDVMLTRKTYEDFVNSLVHVFRNAVDHGIELPDDRIASHKSEVGTINCRYQVISDELVIHISDDGVGIDIGLLKEKLREEQGLNEEALSLMTEEQMFQSIFEDAITTREEVTEISGRGVGLAATKMEVEKLGGSISVSSQAGQGMSIEIRLPWKPELPANKAVELLNEMGTVQALLSVLQQRTDEYLENESDLNDIAVAQMQSDVAELSLTEFTSFLSIAGEFEVWVVYRFDRELLSYLTQSFLEQTEEGTSLEDCREMAAELINIVVGLATQDLNQDSDLPILISTPSVLNKGKTLKIRGDARFFASKINSERGCVEICILEPKALFDDQLNYLES